MPTSSVGYVYLEVDSVHERVSACEGGFYIWRKILYV